jgi:NAD(P)-dependent dehydrogenase (short-subunit alcohol dehydrogenase family)
VRAFVREGAATAFMDIKQEESKDLVSELSPHGPCHFCHGNIVNERDGVAAVREVESLFGPINILVNNAARFVFKSYEASMEDWRASFETNVVGAAFMTRATVESMKRAGGGAIVNTGSISSFIAQSKTMTYNATKAAMVEMTRCMALDLAPFNIRVNCICPGYIVSPALASFAAEAGKTFEELEKDLAPQIILGRVGRPEEIAKCVVFLSSDDASYVTGAYLMADGGMTAL